MFKESFYGLYLLGLNKEITDSKTQTACVSKYNINYQLSVNSSFWTSLSSNVKIAILKHEMLHIIFEHLTSYSSYEDRELFNIAADLEINQYIESSLKDETWSGLELSTFPELSLPVKAGSAKYYELLKKDLNTGKSSALDNLYNNMKQGNIVICSHEAWKEFEKLSDAEKKLIITQSKYQLKNAADVVKAARGTIPSELEELINQLYEKHEPVLDWKAYMRRFAGLSNKTFTHKTRRKENKRYPDSPALKIKQKKHILVVKDTSGSVSDMDIVEFDEEISHIYKTGVSITIVECDAKIQRAYEYKGKPSPYVKGRGGTDFQPPVDYLLKNKHKYNIMIYLTDGECPPPTKPCKPTLWVLCSNRQMRKDLPGQIIQIKR